jgi:peptide/nickel transport system substrate-binding protein
MRRVTTVWCTTVVAVSIALTFPSSAGTTTRPAKDVAKDVVDTAGTLHYAQDLTISGGPTFDPTLTSGAPGQQVFMSLIYDQLVRVAPDGGPEPGLATGWSFPDDHTIVLTLRKGVTFHDSTPFNAAAVKSGLERNLASRNPRFQQEFFQISSVDAVDDRTVRLNLKSAAIGAVFPLMSRIDAYIPSPTAIAQDGSAYNSHPVGAGPYAFVSYTPEESIVLRKNPKHWEAKQRRLAAVQIDQQQSGPATIAALATGKIDVASVSQIDAQGLAGEPDITVKALQSDGGIPMMTICVSKPPFDDVRVRRAMNYALDRDALVDVMTGGNGEPAVIPWPKGSQFYSAKLANRYAHDPKKAKQLLKAAHLATGFSFTLLLPAVPTFQSMAEIIQGSFQDVGITVDLHPSTQVADDLLVRKSDPVALIQTIAPGLQKVTPFISTGGNTNLCGYKSAAVEDGVAELSASVGDPVKDAAAWTGINRAIVDDVPVMYLYFPPVLVAYGPRVGGVRQLYPSGQGVNFRTVYLKK